MGDLETNALELSMPQFLHISDEGIRSMYLLEFLEFRGLNDSINRKYLGQYL